MSFAERLREFLGKYGLALLAMPFLYALGLVLMVGLYYVAFTLPFWLLDHEHYDAGHMSISIYPKTEGQEHDYVMGRETAEEIDSLLTASGFKTLYSGGFYAEMFNPPVGSMTRYTITHHVEGFRESALARGGGQRQRKVPYGRRLRDTREDVHRQGSGSPRSNSAPLTMPLAVSSTSKENPSV